MQSLLHSLNIGTLATWLSVAGLGTVAVVTPQWQHAMPELAVIEETRLFDQDFSIGDAVPADAGGDFSDSEAADLNAASAAGIAAFDGSCPAARNPRPAGGQCQASRNPNPKRGPRPPGGGACKLQCC